MNFVNTPSSTSGGKGGLWGKIAGGALGAISAAAAPFTAGTSLSALPAAGALVAGAAPVIGNAIDPLKVKEGGGPSMLDTAVQRDPILQLGIMKDAQDSLNDSPLPHDQKLETHNYLQAAIDKIQSSPMFRRA